MKEELIKHIESKREKFLAFFLKSYWRDKDFVTEFINQHFDSIIKLVHTQEEKEILNQKMKEFALTI